MGQGRQPEDHKPKKEKPKVVKTDAGFEVSHRGIDVVIPLDALNDFELLRDLGKLQDPGLPDAMKMAAVPSIFTRFFGTQQQRVLDGLRDKESGRVRVEVASTFLFEVFKGLNPES
jgi:hypothetical protein